MPALVKAPDGYYYQREDFGLVSDGKNKKTLGIKHGSVKRNADGKPCPLVFQVDTGGGWHYYLPEDICWRVEPTLDDPGVTASISGAKPRDQYGEPV